MTNKFLVLVSGRSALWLALCLLALPVDRVAVAGTTDDRTESSAFYETATVRARPLSRATASVTVLDRATIQSLDVPTVAELMRFVPGVDVASTGPRAGTATAQIRGGDPNYTYVLIDGVPLNDITDQVGGAVNLNSISTSQVERIEFVRGPLSSSLGSTGLAGAINIITRRGATATPELTLDVAAGDDSVVLGSVALSQGNEKRDYFVSAFWEQQEDSIDTAGARDEFEQLGVQGNARLPVGGSELRLTGRYATWDTLDYPEASGGPLLGSGELRDSEHDELSLGVELHVGRSERRHRIRAMAYRHKLDRVSPLIFNPSNPPASVPASVEDTTYTTWQVSWAAPQLRFANARLDAGIDARIEDGESDSAFPDVPLDQRYRLDRAIGGVFAELVAERGRLLLEFAARLDVPEEFDAELSPRAGVSYRLPGERTRVRASAGRAFKLPSFFALAVPVFGNPDLEPETVISVDAGVEHTFVTARLTTALNWFFNRFEDLVDFDDLLFTHVNVPEIESRGIELAVDWKPVDRVDVQANVTRQDFDDEPDGNPLTHRPEWIGSTRIVWRIGDRASWAVDGQWVSESFDFQVPVGTTETPGYQLYGTAVSYEVTPRWHLHARVDNLADKKYEPFVGFPGPDRSFRVGVRRTR